jgi:predicted nucleic acid-binding protein
MSSTLDCCVISNTSPLLYLHQVGQLEILPKLYGEIMTPVAVEQELLVGKQQGINVPNIPDLDWLEVHTIASETNIPNVIDLGRGEAEVIALGFTYPNSLLILDDQLGRKIVAFYQLRYTGTLGILIKAKQAGHLTKIAPVISKLQEQGMWLTESVVQTVLKLAGES